MKKTFVISGLILSMFAMTACGANTSGTSGQGNSANSSTAGSGNLYQTIKQQGTITIGTEGTYAPFDYHDNTGKLTGFDVEIAEQVAQRLGVKPKFVESQWDGLLEGLFSHRYDMVADEVAITPERKAKYDFSTPYIVSRAVLIVRSDNNTIKSFKDLKGHTAGQSLTSNLADIARQNGAHIQPVSGFNEAISLLESGRIDATVNDELSFLDFKKHHPNAPLKVVASWNNAAEEGFAMPKGNPELVQAVNKALADMKKDGTYLKISEKYFGVDVSK
ncbi:amino acid ABC transporter substrate-binding protein [Alicyclobacillus contaminans]|uniref:amino acid ABC transporter substrate-binding protein n=1 Tax=Alicyclobacillus contaminans TaxID=392016 RepID=UPI0003FD47ED|nr:amino acid ABC transporter substrate-binding protein [Alicyclobacillus contaminans]GMA50282.1 amino acid ABC transporter substrate-binding protein [Alicyclobacillus contaminans]